MNLYEIKALKAHEKIKDLANKTAVTLSHTFADNTARDTYFTANPIELVENLFIKVGTGYQQYINSTWEEATAVVADISALEQDLATQKTTYTSQIGNTANLATTSKEVVGAINETKEQINNLDADKANQTDLNLTNNKKADIIYVDEKFALIGNANPKGVYPTLTDLNTAFPTGNTNIYVVTADGKWYYWNGSAWTVGGTYQSTTIAKNSITDDNLAPTGLKSLFYVVLENEIKGGNFPDATAWIGAGATLTANSNKLLITGTGTGTVAVAKQNTNIPCSTGKRIYYKFRGKVTNPNAVVMTLEYTGTTGGAYAYALSKVNSPVENQEYTFEGIITLTNQTGNFMFRMLHQYADAATATNKVMEAQYVIAIDCDKFTAGTGLDATVENITLFLDKYENKWFDGLQHIVKKNVADIITMPGIGTSLVDMASDIENLKDRQELVHRKDYILSEGSVIADFNDFENWINSMPANGNIAKDITFSKSGDSALRFNVTNPGAYVQAEKDINLDLSNTNHRVSMWIYLHDEPANYAEVTVQLFNVFSTAMFACYRATGRYHKGWNMLTISDNEWVVGSGSPSWNSKFVKLRVRVMAAPGKTCKLTVSDMRIGMEFSPKIIFRFDDALAGVYQNAYPIMNAKGIKSTIYANSDIVGASSNFCDLAQLQEMYSAGHDIGNHGKSHTGLAVMNYAQTLTEVGDCQNWLIQNGFYKSARHFCVPNGQDTEYLQYALDTLGVLTSTNSVHSTFMSNMDLHKIPCQAVVNTTTFEQVKAWIDDAILNGKTLVLQFHNIVNVLDGSTIDITYEYLTADFQAICDYLYNNNLIQYVVPMSEFYIGLNK